MKNRKLRKLNLEEVSGEELAVASFLDSRIIRQAKAKKALCVAWRTARNPLRNPYRPLFVALFIGPSRSGKSSSVSALAEYLHGDPEALVDIEGGEYKLEHQVARLIGAPPGYLGHKPPQNNDQNKGEQQQVQFDPSAKLARANLVASRKGSKRPVTIIRINEIEKAHESLFDILLGVYDKGVLELGNNLVTDFRDCIFVMTSNLGMRELKRRKIGFMEGALTVKHVKDVVDTSMDQEFRPEFKNRIDEVVIFEPLMEKDIREVVDVEVRLLQERMVKQLPRNQIFELSVDEEARDFLLSEADKTSGGVADLKRVIKRHIEDALGNGLITGTIRVGDVVVVTHEKGEPALSFFVDEEQAAKLSVADQMDVKDTAESHSGLVFQRLVDRAIYKAARTPKQSYKVTMVAKDINSLYEQSAGMIHDLRQVFEIELDTLAYAVRGRCVFVAKVWAIPEQIALFKHKYPELKVTEVAEKPEGQA